MYNLAKPSVGRIPVDTRVPDSVEVQVTQFTGCIEYEQRADLANIADILLRVALGIIVFPTDRRDTSDHATVRDYAARYLVPLMGR